MFSRPRLKEMHGIALDWHAIISQNSGYAFEFHFLIRFARSTELQDLHPSASLQFQKLERGKGGIFVKRFLTWSKFLQKFIKILYFETFFIEIFTDFDDIF